MLVANYTSLISFIPQYVVATLIALYVFSTLRKRRFYSRPGFLADRVSPVMKAELIGMSFYSTLENLAMNILVPMIIPFPGQIKAGLPSSEYRTGVRRDMPMVAYPFLVKKRRSSFKAPSSVVKFPEVFLRKRAYDLYSALFPIAVWAGILLLLTPYQKIFFFIPHFASLTVNLVVIIILSITIFEGTLATIFLFIGTSGKRVAAVILSVLGVFSLSLLTPSFNWFRIYTFGGEILIYSILGILLLSTTFLISLLKEKRILFSLSFYSTVLAYVFFLSTTAYNIITTLMQIF